MDPEQHLRLIDARLEGMSVARRLVTSLGHNPPELGLAIHREGSVGFTPDAPALPPARALPLPSHAKILRGSSAPPAAAEAGPARPPRPQAAVSNVLNPFLPM